VNGLLLALLLVQVSPQNNGGVTGVVRGANGMPAPGVRVYAMAVRDAVEQANAGTALESQAQTDAAGRYRLEVPVGRYYIASGSIGAPTYFPGTTNLGEARVFSIAAGQLVEDIDFSSFVPAPARGARGGTAILPVLQPGSTGVLEGVIRFPHGVFATGTTVLAVPSAMVAGPGLAGGTNSASITTTIALSGLGVRGQSLTTRRVVNGHHIVQGRTDALGRYRFDSMPPDTYYIATGFEDAPIFFPGTADIRSAKTFTTTPTTLLDNLDFTMPLPAFGVSVRGRVTAAGDAPAAGAEVQLAPRTQPSTSFAGYGLPVRNLSATVTVNADGTFEARNVLPGDYVVESHSSDPPVRLNLTVADQPVSGLRLSLPMAVLSGRILLEDGSALPDAQLFIDAIVTTINNPNLVASTILRIASDGTFGRLMDADDYRFYLRNLPDEYVIKSITSDTQDLLKETVKVTSIRSVNVEVRVAWRAGPSANEVTVGGSVIDGVTRLPVSAGRVTLCCLNSGPTERFSTPSRGDGSFEFAGVPPGHYTLGLQYDNGQVALSVINPDVDVTNGPVSGLTVLSKPAAVPAPTGFNITITTTIR
jgi:protocatechuate 3,4-dioxygenase beta subunit